MEVGCNMLRALQRGEAPSMAVKNLCTPFFQAFYRLNHVRSNAEDRTLRFSQVQSFQPAVQFRMSELNWTTTYRNHPCTRRTFLSQN